MYAGHFRFLLPVLQLRTILNEPTLGEMENKLADLSGSLGDAFADTISRIQRLPESRSRLGMGALMWLCHTTRALSEPQLSDALAIHGEQNAVNFKYRPATKTILECCQGLATIDGEGSIRFAHYAIREYLRDHSTDFFPHAEVTITVNCLRYLVFKDFQDGPWSTGDEIETKMAMYPFLSWAATYWGQFARRTENDSEVWSALFVFFSSPAATSVSNQVRQYSMGRRENYWDASECRSFSALHHASRHGLQRALGKLLESGAYGINERTQMGSTPIIHAVAGGHVRTARDLLAHGADPYLCNWYGDALHCAIEANHPTTVREPIHWGMDPNAVRDGNRHYLLSVLDSDAAGVLAVLIELGADMMSPSIVKAHGHLFFAAAFLGCPRVIELMLKRKWVEVEARNPKGLSAMHYAILSADMMTVRTLFDAGADIDVTDSDGRKPLDYAKIENNKSMVQLLRDLGAR